jgi:hypothetical protein
MNWHEAFLRQARSDEAVRQTMSPRDTAMIKLEKLVRDIVRLAT